MHPELLKLFNAVRDMTQLHIDGLLTWSQIATIIGELLEAIYLIAGSDTRDFAFNIHMNMLPNGYHVYGKENN